MRPGDGGGPRPPREPVGTLGEETARLVEALQDWAGGRADAWGLGGAAECRLCPVCQFIAVLRQTRPEAVGHLTDAAASFTAALCELVGPANRDGAARHAGGVQHIDIG